MQVSIAIVNKDKCINGWLDIQNSLVAEWTLVSGNKHDFVGLELLEWLTDFT